MVSNPLTPSDNLWEHELCCDYTWNIAANYFQKEISEILNFNNLKILVQ